MRIKKPFVVRYDTKPPPLQGPIAVMSQGHEKKMSWQREGRGVISKPSHGGGIILPLKHTQTVQPIHNEHVNTSRSLAACGVRHNEATDESLTVYIWASAPSSLRIISC